MTLTEKISREQIRETKIFRSLNSPMQQLTLRTYNFLKLQEEFTIATAIGYETWEKKTQVSYANRVIIKELLVK